MPEGASIPEPRPSRLPTGPELLLLASGALLFVPGLRAVWAWVWVGWVPGYFFARRVVGLHPRTFPLVAFSLFFSGLLFPVTATLPLALGAPLRPGSIFLLGVGFAGICLALTARKPLPVIHSGWPHALFWVLPVLGLLAQLAQAIWGRNVCIAQMDEPYFVGMTHAFTLGFPPLNFEEAPQVLKQPWLQWLGYALDQVGSGLPTCSVFPLASGTCCLGFCCLLYCTVDQATRDRRVASIAGALPYAASAPFAPTGDPGTLTFAQGLQGAFYNLFFLSICLAVLWMLAQLNRTRREAWFWGAMAVLALQPFFHPIYFFFTAVSALAILLERVYRWRGQSWRLAVLALTPLPFWLIFVRWYAGSLSSNAVPFTLRLTADAILSHASRFLTVDAALIALAAIGWQRVIQLRLALASVVLVGFGLTAFTVNLADNFHWTYDAASVALLIFAAAGLGRLWFEWRPGRIIAPLLLCAGVLFSGIPQQVWQRLRPDPTEVSDAETGLASWLAQHTAPTAILLTTPGYHAARVAEGMAERPLFLGRIVHVSNTLSREALAARYDLALEMLQNPCSPELSSNRIAYAVLERLDPTEMGWNFSTRAWMVLTPAYENERYRVFAPPTPADCTGGLR